ncbi:hypothetical protein ACFOU0_04720 [Salinicoccus sesuvii]|uniref:Uncharacterized protein n=1 Tax=Salinicoccus sesuvii TaxID=868281 RepID=A0ABV7N2S3_9STAP
MSILFAVEIDFNQNQLLDKNQQIFNLHVSWKECFDISVAVNHIFYQFLDLLRLSILFSLIVPDFIPVVQQAVDVSRFTLDIAHH